MGEPIVATSVFIMAIVVLAPQNWIAFMGVTLMRPLSGITLMGPGSGVTLMGFWRRESACLLGSDDILLTFQKGPEAQTSCKQNAKSMLKFHELEPATTGKSANNYLPASLYASKRKLLE